MNESPLLQLFDEVVVEVATELLDGYGLRARVGYLEPEITREQSLATVVGFVGSGVRGSLMLMASRRVIAETATGVEWTEAHLRDWIGELGNQLLGGVRRLMAARGVRVSMGLPAVVASIRLDIRSIDHRYTRAFAFQTPAGPIVVTVDAVGSPRYAEDDGIADGLPSEGKLSLF